MDYNYVPKYVDETIDYQGGEVVKHSDYNRNLNLLNVAVANNTDALKRILNNGGAHVLNALALNGAQLKRHRDVILQDSEDQVPSSKAVYEHVKLLSDSADARFNNVGNILDNQDTEMFKINKRIQVVNSLIEQQGGRFNEIEEDYAHITDTMRGGATGQVLAKQSSNPLDYTWTNLLPGPKGDPGNDGYTPIKGVDYIDGEDGYTPVKGVDYFDGEDGYTPIKGVDYFDGVDGTDGAQGPQGIPGPQGNPGTNGTNGTDGVDGAQGPQGPQGPQGIPGPQGPPGANGTNGTNGVDGEDGYTPVKGVDYFDGADGAPGADGADGEDGVGIPTGGTTGQALVKASTTDYDFNWGDISPSGGGAYYFIPSTEGTATNPLIISDKPVGTYYFLDTAGRPGGRSTLYYKRTATSTCMSVTNMLNINIIESNIDAITDENVVVSIYATSNGLYYALLTKNHVDGFSTSIFGTTFVDISRAQSISGVKTFTNLPKSSVAPTEVEHLVNKEYVDNQLSNLMNLIYPIGSIYMSAIADNPGVLFGGTWVAWGTGRVPVGVDASDTDFDTVEKTGGSKFLQEHNHTATTNSTGAHTHNAQGFWRGSGNTSQDRVLSYVKTSDKANNTYGTTSILSAGDHTHTVTVANAGEGNAQNLQPYITCYMWKRTA